MSGTEPAMAKRIEVIVPAPEVENRDFGYFDSPPKRLLQRQTASDGHVFQWILTSQQGDVFVRWVAAIPAAGRYQVAVFVPKIHATSTLARYFVHGIVGRDDPSEHVVNQAGYFDAWVPLGTFEFDPAAGPEIFVDAQNATPETPAQEFAFDAIRWQLVPQDAVRWVWPVLDEPHLIGHPFNEPRPSFGANHLHEGVDIQASEGKQVVSVASGTVAHIHRWNSGTLKGEDAYGNSVIIEHDDGSGYRVLYGHLDDFASGLAEGDHVAAGQLLGFAGSTGNSTASHLHLHLTHPLLGLDGYVYARVVDPTPFLRGVDEGPGAIIAPEEDLTVTNQDAINLLFKIAPDLGQEGWGLVMRLGWESLAVPTQNRNLEFDTARLQGKPAGLTDAEWNYVTAKLTEMLQRHARVQFARMPEGFHALPGVHGPADPGDWAWTQNNGRAIQIVRESRVAAVKVFVPDISAATILELQGIATVRFLLARLLVQMPAQVGNSIAERAEFFLNQVDPVSSGNGGPLARAFNAGLRYFEVHNEPNVSDEGMFTNWSSGREFADFFTRITARLRARYPGARFGFPGCSPGEPIPDRRYPMTRFLSEAWAAIRDADFLCAHYYWGKDGTASDVAVQDLRLFCYDYPDKVVFLSEFSNNAEGVDKDVKGDEYRDFYAAVRSLPPNLGAVFSYCLSSTAQYEHETWIEKGGTASGIIHRIGL